MPEAKEVHAKMRKHFNLKLALASDPQRAFLSAYKVPNIHTQKSVCLIGWKSSGIGPCS